MSCFFFNDLSSSSTVFNAVMLLTDKTVPRKPSPNILLFANLNIPNKDLLIFSGKVDTTSEVCNNFSVPHELAVVVNLTTHRLMSVVATLPFTTFFFGDSFCFENALSPIVNYV